MSQLRVRNVQQKILWDEELSGQISDGMWENASPWDHWQPWCDADVVVAPDGNVGRTFWARKDSYLFTSQELLSIVGDRMLGYVRDASTRDHDGTGGLPEFPDYTMKEMMADLRDLRKIIKIVTSETTPTPGPTHADIRAAWRRYHDLKKLFPGREIVPPVIGADEIVEPMVLTRAPQEKIDEAMKAVAFS
jgi:hypothetical protein